jgi:hypothetical protein
MYLDRRNEQSRRAVPIVLIFLGFYPISQAQLASVGVIGNIYRRLWKKQNGTQNSR